ncbi:sensor histidine kinase [Parvicella tangerina]|uniref:histidine kinase n=1 Tax=Parvicella tangerina TaxID=2829795 RepID=A0A916JP97_9FLAO|nr:ATP-binding protein [Parvicella tangerina]CAG5085322.1 Adaptive-response sensory-kinase SasA [Parvicella tangerina]
MISTPRQFAIFISLILAIIATAFVGLGSWLAFDDFDLILTVITFIVAGTISYFVVFYLLEKLVTNKIRILYRTIHSFKINKGDFPINMDDDVLEKTEKEVFSWVKTKREEIERLKEQEAFRREFIGNLAHELRTPIFSIQGYILTLLEGGIEDESINVKFLERASKGVDRMTNILEDLDTITKIESERVKINKKNIDIKDLAEEILESFEMKAEEKGIRLMLESQDMETVMVNCDRDKIGQVLTNLINNALNYGNEGGYVKVRFFDFEDHYLVEVADNGIGIEEKHLPRLFERFYRVDKSRSRHDGGTGLGLAIVKHIVEAHGQMINVRSTPGEGATFSFTLQKAIKE